MSSTTEVSLFFSFSIGTTELSSDQSKSTPRKSDLLSELKPREPPSKEHTKLVIFGVARIHRTRLLATLSGLKLEAEITSLHSSLTVRKKSNPDSLESSITGQVGRTMIVLLEGVAPNQQTVVKVTVGKSQTIYSSLSKKMKDKNSGGYDCCLYNSNKKLFNFFFINILNRKKRY